MPIIDISKITGGSMIVYWSIFIYTAVVSLLFSKYKSKKSVRIIDNEKIMIRKVGIVGAMISFALLIFFTGLRADVADTFMYISVFNETTYSLSDIPNILISDEKGPLWVVCMVFFKHCISDDCVHWLMSIAIFQGFAVAKFLSNFSEDFAFSAYLFIADSSFTWMLNGIRQFTAVCILLLAYKLLINKKYIFFIIIVLISYKIHNTIILFIPFCFFINMNPFKIKTIIILILLTISFSFIMNSPSILTAIGYDDNYTESFSEDDGVNVMSVVLYSIPAIISLISKKRLSKTKYPKYINTFINSSIIATLISFIGTFTSGILVGRLPIYFSMSNLVLLPWIIENGLKEGSKNIIKYLCYIGYFLYFIYYMAIANGAMTYHSAVLGIRLYG